MLYRAALLLTSLGLLLGGALCLCAEDHSHGSGDASPGGHHSAHGHDHSEDEGTLGGEAGHHSNDGESSHEHGEGAPCDCAGPGDEIVPNAAATIAIEGEGQSIPTEALYCGSPVSAPLKERLLPFALDNGPPRSHAVSLLLKHHRLNL